MPRLKFTDDEWSLIAELLRLAQMDLFRTHEVLAMRFPESKLCERLQQWAENAADFRERIEGR